MQTAQYILLVRICFSDLAVGDTHVGCVVLVAGKDAGLLACLEVQWISQLMDNIPGLCSAYENAITLALVGIFPRSLENLNS